MPEQTPARYPRRAARAARTRSAIIAAAGELFAERGYRGTTMKDIAEHAGASVETVYLIGSKRSLLGTALTVLFMGEETEEPLPDQDAWAAVLALEDTGRVLELYVDLLTTSVAATSALWRAACAAADGDPEIAAMLDVHLERRRRDIAFAGPWLLARGMVSEETVEEAVASLSVLVSHETYDHLIRQFGWSLDQYRAWLTDALRRLVLNRSTS